MISQALNNTTCQVNLLDVNQRPTETNVAMTFYEKNSRTIKYNFVHTLNGKGNPDTLHIDPLGIYKIVVNFLTGKYTVTPVFIPSNLYIVGDATPGGWANPVPTPSQQFTQTSPGVFQLSLSLTATKSYLFLPVNGDWTHKYGGASDGVTADGDLLADGDVPGSNTPAPPTTGNRTITVNFVTMKYKVQ